MFEKEIKDRTLTILSQAAPEDIELAVKALEEFLNLENVYNTGEFKIVAGQVIENAVVHGNQNDLDKQIRMELEAVGNGRFRLAVEDQGAGFDHKSLAEDMDDPFSDSVGGLAIIQSFTDKMEFNDTGNRITLHLTMETEQGPDAPQPDRERQPDAAAPRDQEEKEAGPEPSATVLDRDMALVLMNRALNAAKSGEQEFVVDLKGITDISVHGLNLFAGIKAHFKNFPGTSLAVINADRDIKKLLQMTGLCP